MDLINLLKERERRIVSVLAAVFGSVFILLLVFGVRARIDAGRMAARRSGIEAGWKSSERSRTAAVTEWSRWTQAETDIQDLRRTWFYDQGEGIQAMRTDLREVLEKAGVTALDISYGEADIVKDRLRRVAIVFDWSGSYPAFRHLLETLEAHPRALYVSKIDFRNSGGSPGYIEAGITLEGYSLHE